MKGQTKSKKTKIIKEKEAKKKKETNIISCTIEIIVKWKEMKLLGQRKSRKQIK